MFCNIVMERILIQSRRTNSKPVTYQLDYSEIPNRSNSKTTLEPRPNPMCNCLITLDSHLNWLKTALWLHHCKILIAYSKQSGSGRCSVFAALKWNIGFYIITNTRRIRKPLACGSWFTNSSRVLPTSRVVYQLINHRNLWSIA